MMPAEGATRDEAVDELKLLLQDRLSDGVEIASAKVPGADIENAWVKYARHIQGRSDVC